MQNETVDSKTLIPVVGIGASAGGLEAISELLEALEHDLGLAYLVCTHMDPRHESHLAEILEKRTPIVVCEAKQQVIEPDHAYIIPPDTVMTLSGNVLVLSPRSDGAGRHLPIDALFDSIARERPEYGVGIVLSGTGSDGTQGIKHIKEAAGITIVQEPTSATFDGMPVSAIQTGCVDLVLRPFEIAKELAKIAQHPYFQVGKPKSESTEEQDQDAAMRRIFELLQSVYQADFTQYKPNTIERRLERRMALANEVKVESYVKLLQENRIELAALYDDFLIRVTSFFREESIHTALRQTVFPKLLKGRSHTEPLRVWVPACATGEEVYSFAISFLEYLGDNPHDISIQIFGTDLNEAAIEQARQGLYPESIAERVSASRLKRFFVHENHRYRVAKRVREMCVFARQNVAIDPPFSRMDVISCCNLLIYLDTGLQRRVLRHFHYGLKPDGFLILGPAENADEDSHYFKRAEGSHRMLYRRAMPARGSLDTVVIADPARKASSVPEAASESTFFDNSQVQRKADGLLLSRFSPASILVDDRLNIVQFRGQTSPYLEHASGTASLNLHRVAHPSILLQLVPAIKEAQESGTTIFKGDLRVETLYGQRDGSLEVIPLREPSAKTCFFLILFDANVRPAKPEGRPDIPESEKDTRIRQLEEELEGLRDYLHGTNEAYEAALEESRSAQEELQSANEEFLSGNEELVTAREELQAANEELTTANEELLSRARELQVLNTEISRARKIAEFNSNYAESVIDTVLHPLLVLDQSLVVHRANNAFYDIFQTNPSATLNRPLYQLGNGQWEVPELKEILDKVLTVNETVTSYRVDQAFPALGQRTMLLSARKVPAMDNRSARLLIAFEDVTESEHRIENLHADDRRKDEFIALLAHELRNPLAPIRNAVDLMSLKVQDEALLRPLKMIGRQVTTMSRLVDDLMDISRITRGQFSLEKKPVELVTMLTHSVNAIRPYLDQRGHELTLSLPDAQVYIDGDVTRLEQVFGNLLNNAAKYTDQGGHITLGLTVEDQYAVIVVKDNGAGIAPSVLPHIFDLFVQSDTTRARAEGGLGIGLTLVKQIVERHGGSVRAASGGHNQGSTFTVCFPLSEASDFPLTDEKVSSTFREKTSSPRRVIVVDDNVDAANSIAEMLRHWGHDVELAYDGFSAMEIARIFRPEVALLDIGLPQMSGYELAEKLQKSGNPMPFLVAITGFGQDVDREASRKAGFNIHLIKPVDTSELQLLVDTLKI